MHVKRIYTSVSDEFGNTYSIVDHQGNGKYFLLVSDATGVKNWMSAEEVDFYFFNDIKEVSDEKYNYACYVPITVSVRVFVEADEELSDDELYSYCTKSIVLDVSKDPIGHTTDGEPVYAVAHGNVFSGVQNEFDVDKEEY